MIIKIKKKWLKRAVLLLSAIVLGMILSELMIRIFLPQMLYNKHNPYHPDFDETFRLLHPLGLLPNPYFETVHYGEEYRLVHVKHNNAGFRDDLDYTLYKNKKRIILFGDSMVYGAGVDQKEAIHYYLRDFISNGYEIYNFAFPSSGTNLHYRLMKVYAAGFNPDIVIFFIYPNDFDDITAPDSEDYILRPKFIIDYDTEYGIESIRDYAELNWKGPYNTDQDLNEYYNQSEYEQIIKNILRQDPHSAPPQNKIVLFLYKYSQIYNMLRNAKNKPDYNINSSILRLFQKQPLYKTVYANNLMCRLLKNIDDVTDSWNQTRLVVVYIPTEGQIYESIRKRYQYNPEDYDFRLLNKVLAECTDNNDISFLDLTPKSQELADNGKKLYGRYGEHWSPYGAKMAAKEVSLFLKEEGII